MAEKLCWDCPRRGGLSRTAGKIACWYMRFKEEGSRLISEQRGDCVGRVPVKAFSQFGISHEVGEEVVTTTRKGHIIYLAGCPKGMEEIPEVPVEVTSGFGRSGRELYAQPINEVSITLRAKYDARLAGIKESFERISADAELFDTD